MQAVILAGGFGTRLSHVVSDVPKPMAPIKGAPFLELMMHQLCRAGFDNFVFLTGHKAEIIETYFQNDSRIKCIRETSPLGTGGAVLNAFPELADEFFVINGDTFFDIDFSLVSDFGKTRPAAIALRYSSDIARYGLVDVNDEFQITGFVEKGKLPKNLIDGYINGGIYYFKKQTLQPYYENFHGNFVSMEQEIFPELIKKGQLRGLPVGGTFIDIGVPEDYYRAQDLIPATLNMLKKPVVFVDKDGTLIENTGYPSGKHATFIESTADLLGVYKKRGYGFVMVTNQAGLAKAKFSIQDMRDNIETVQKFYQDRGITFDLIETCPYHVDAVVAEYKFASKRRKPDAGMVLAACEKMPIDLKKSVMIGDNPDVDRIKLPYLKTIILGGKQCLK